VSSPRAERRPCGARAFPPALPANARRYCHRARLAVSRHAGADRLRRRQSGRGSAGDPTASAGRACLSQCARTAGARRERRRLDPARCALARLQLDDVDRGAGARRAGGRTRARDFLGRRRVLELGWRALEPARVPRLPTRPGACPRLPGGAGAASDPAHAGPARPHRAEPGVAGGAGALGMKVLLLAEWLHHMGGCETFLTTVCDHLPAFGIEASLFVATQPVHERWRAAFGERLTEVAEGDDPLDALIAHIERTRPDLIHAVPLDRTAVRLARLTDRPVLVGTEASDGSERCHWPSYGPALAAAFPHFDAIHCF